MLSALWKIDIYMESLCSATFDCVSKWGAQRLEGGRRMRSWIYFPRLVTLRFFSSSVMWPNISSVPLVISSHYSLLPISSNFPFFGFMSLNRFVANDPESLHYLPWFLQYVHNFVTRQFINKPSSNFLILVCTLFLIWTLPPSSGAEKLRHWLYSPGVYERGLAWRSKLGVINI